MSKRPAKTHKHNRINQIKFQNNEQEQTNDYSSPFRINIARNLVRATRSSTNQDVHPPLEALYFQM